MPRSCDHDVRETKRGAGPCDIKAEVKLRNGNPNWWCHTHGMAAGGPGGVALESCPGSWLDPVPKAEILELDASRGELAVWGAIAPAVVLGEVEDEPGKVHVHHRDDATSAKDIDASFAIVRVQNGKAELEIEGMAAVAYSISELAGRAVTPLTCTHCGEVHIDELKFATFAHSKHLCNSCGRNFRDRSPSISNPLADANAQLDLARAHAPERPDRPLFMSSLEFSGIALWPSNSAIVNTMTRPEEEGIHVHAWDLAGNWVIDETYSEVTLDGQRVDEELLRLLAIQRALAHGAPIIALDCQDCRQPLRTPADTYLEPVTRHPCACGATTRTSLRSFINPLVRTWPVRD